MLPAELERVRADAAANYVTRYRKKTDGTKRRIDAPSAELKPIQRLILDGILRRLPVHRANHCRPGFSIVTNARRHLGSRHVAAFDVEGAFPSTPATAVRVALASGLHDADLPTSWIEPLLELTTLRGALPQGAPTSPDLFSLVMYPVDVEMERLARRFHGRYTRYADDLIFSSPERLRGLERAVTEVLGRHGFRLAVGKSRWWSPHRPATVTGLVLRRAVMVQDDVISRLDTLFTSAARLGGPTDVEWNQIQGLISFVESVERGRGRELRRALNKLDRPRPS